MRNNTIKPLAQYSCHTIMATAVTMALLLSTQTAVVHGAHRHGWTTMPTTTAAASAANRHQATLLSLRGGSTTFTKKSNNAFKSKNHDDEENDDDSTTTTTTTSPQQQKQQEKLERISKLKKEYQKLLKYQTEQQMLYQLRSTYLSEMMASRGLGATAAAGTTGGGLPTLASVATKEGEKPPEKCDWDCALCTEEDPKSCLYSFDAEPNTKVIAPQGTTQYISLTALNRLRRTDPTKVEPMWHSRYSILHSWFSEESEYSILQHVGLKGFIVSSILLDGGNGMVLKSLLVMGVLAVIVALMPLLEYILGRILVSAPFWSQWTTWGRVLRAGFPLKLLIGQLAWKGVANSFGKLEGVVREYIVDLECEILEECVPLTVGVEAEEEEDNDVEMEDESEELSESEEVEEMEGEFSESEDLEGDYDIDVDESDIDEYDDDEY